jgi:hypothetical protein
MIKKNLLMLLVAASMTVPAFAETTVANDAVVSTTSFNDVTDSGIPTTSPDLAPASDKKARMAKVKEFAIKQLENNRTFARCVALFAAKNLTSRYLGTFKKKHFDLPVYAMWTVKALVNAYLPSTSEATKAKIAEFIAGEISFVKLNRNATDAMSIDSTNWTLADNFTPKTARKIIYKAGSRKQFFLPKDSKAGAFLRENPLAMIAMPFVESLHDTADIKPKGAAATGDSRLSHASAVRPLFYAFNGLFAGKVAEDMGNALMEKCPDKVMDLVASGKCPEKILAILMSPHTSELVKNLMAQVIEDSLNTGIDWQIKNS